MISDLRLLHSGDYGEVDACPPRFPENNKEKGRANLRTEEITQRMRELAAATT